VSALVGRTQENWPTWMRGKNEMIMPDGKDDAIAR
jgi:hypothetical protein